MNSIEPRIETWQKHWRAQLSESVPDCAGIYIFFRREMSELYDYRWLIEHEARIEWMRGHLPLDK